MSYTPFNESKQPISRDSNQDGISIRAYSNIMQGVEIRDPLRLRRGVLPKIGLKSIKIDQDGFVDNTLEINDLGQNIKASTSFFVDTTEKWTPVQILQNNLAEGFLKEIATRQNLEEDNDGKISVFAPNGNEIPFAAHGTKSSVFSSDPYRGWQPIDNKYQLISGVDEFLDGQEEILKISVPQIQSTNFLNLEPFSDNIVDDTDRFGINILNQEVDLYNRYAASGFVYDNNVRDSIAFGGLKG